MEMNKEWVVDELRKQGNSEHVQRAMQVLPDKIDHERHAAMLKQFGLDPGQLVVRALKSEEAKI